LADELYFEDLQPGMKIRSIRSYEVTAEEIKEFAAKYDPQPFHLDEAAAEKTFFKGLAASGWMTAAITMRLRVESIHVADDQIYAAGAARGLAAHGDGDSVGAALDLKAGDWVGEVEYAGVQPAG
jgi:acyl dehydratase